MKPPLKSHLSDGPSVAEPAKHTPTPWRLNLQPAPRHGTLIALFGNSENEFFHGITGARHVRKEEMHANAKLATAAPDLLAACEALLLALKETMPGVRHIACQNYEILNTAPLLARAAIQKARP